MRKSLGEYIPAVIKGWWAVLVFAVGDILGIAATVRGKGLLLPSWGWFAIGTTALFVAQFLAFHNMRTQRDEAKDRLKELEQSKTGGNSIVVEGDVYGSIITGDVHGPVSTQTVEPKSPMPCSHFEDRKLYIGELFRDSHLIDGATFRNCEIIGPGMLGLDSKTRLNTCEFYYGESIDAMLVTISGGIRWVTGAVGFTNCVFERCRFKRVGFLVSEIGAQAFRDALTKKKKGNKGK